MASKYKEHLYLNGNKLKLNHLDFNKLVPRNLILDTNPLSFTPKRRSGRNEAMSLFKTRHFQFLPESGNFFVLAADRPVQTVQAWSPYIKGHLVSPEMNLNNFRVLQPLYTYLDSQDTGLVKYQLQAGNHKEVLSKYKDYFSGIDLDSMQMPDKRNIYETAKLIHKASKQHLVLSWTHAIGRRPENTIQNYKDHIRPFIEICIENYFLIFKHDSLDYMDNHVPMYLEQFSLIKKSAA